MTKQEWIKAFTDSTTNPEQIAEQAMEEFHRLGFRTGVYEVGSYYSYKYTDSAKNIYCEDESDLFVLILNTLLMEGIDYTK